MANSIKMWFDGARCFVRGWRRCRLFGEGVLLLLLAVMLGTCVIPVEEEPRSVDDELHSLPNYDYIGEVEKLKDTSKEEAKELARYIFETEGMPNQDKARRIYDEIEKDQKSWWNRTKRTAIGFATGEGQSLEELGGSVASDMFLYGDVRDLIKHSWYKVTKNEKGDDFIITLAACGLVTEFVDVVDWVPAVLKAFRKVGALSKKMVGFLSDGMKRVIKTRKVDGELKSLFSGIKLMTDSLGFARASQVMRHADTAADVAMLAKAAKVAPNETYLMVKYSGKKGVKNLEGLSDKQYKILREVAKKGPDALKNVKKYLNAVKSKTTNVRRISRLLKSIQSGHLTGFVHKLALASPIVRFLVIVLAVICLIIATRKFWMSVRMPKIVVLVGLCLAANNIWAYTPYGMSRQERKRILREEAVRMEARRMDPGSLALQAGPDFPEDRYEDDRNTIHYVGENWGRMPGESQADQQAKALGAMMLLGALCEQAKKEQEQQEVEARQKEMAKQENQPQPKASERQVAPTSVKKHKKSMGAGMWFVLALLGCVGAYVIYGELKHRSEPRGKQLPKLNRPNIVCPHCGCAYEYDPELIGVVVQCSSCNKKFVVQKTA